MEADLLAKLFLNANLTDLVSTRINWLRRPQGEAIPKNKGAIVLSRVDGVTDYHHGGASGLVATRIQAECWATSYGAAKAVARAAEAAVCGFSFTQGATRFDVILKTLERDDTFEEAPNTYYRTSLDWLVRHAAAS